MNSTDWLARCKALLAERRERHLLRELQTVRAIGPVQIEFQGRQYVNFSSNNYLGLTHHPRVLAALKDVRQAGTGAAGLIAGHLDAHQRAETRLAAWKGTEAALLLPSGYQANLAAVQALAGIGESYGGGVRFLIDKLSHASLIDAIRSTGSAMRVFPHNGMAKLRRLLEEGDPEQLQVVMSESIFSMDGDRAPLEKLAQLKKDHPFVLLLDQAHGSGVYGPGGAGLAAELGLQSMVDVSVVTLSKALGCAGGAVCASTIFRDAMLNFGRAYIYSTSVSPTIPATVEAAIDVLRDEPHRQQRVRDLARNVRNALTAARLPILPGDSPIIPIILGDEERTLEASRRLREGGMWVIGVRPPTVSPGASRLRVTLSCEHSDEQIERLIDALQAFIGQDSADNRA